MARTGRFILVEDKLIYLGCQNEKLPSSSEEGMLSRRLNRGG